MENLKEELMDYFGTAMANGNPMATIQLAQIENASAQELIALAEQVGISVDD